MNSKYPLHISHFSLGLLTLLFVLHSPLLTLGQVTTFTYQGRLMDTNNSPANGLYDFRFTVYVSENNPGSVAGPILLPATPVTNGLFTVTLDFGGSYPFPGFDRWLGIEVRTNGSGPFAALSPRQEVTPTPYAITAQNVLSGGLSGNPVTFNNPANSFSGNGGGLTNVNAATLGGYGYCGLPCYWNLTGNAGTSPGLDFVGTSDNQPLTLKVNNTTALQLVPGASLPNVVGGRGAFRPSILASGVSGVVIAGGNAPSGAFSGIGAGDYMAAYDDDAAIGGGFGNKVGTDNGDPTDAAFATVAGGIFNSAANFAATVGGGAANTASGTRSVVAGGNGNSASGDYSGIAGGNGNHIAPGAINSFVGAGVNNSAGSGNTVVAGGANNIADVNAAAVAGGSENHAGGDHAFIGGGQGNAESAAYATIGGGAGNVVQTNSLYSSVGGGYVNTIRPGATESTIGGGYGNSAGGVITNTSISGATVAGGVSNRADCAYSFIGGGKNNLVLDTLTTPIATSPYAVIAGGEANTVDSYGSTSDHSAIGGGYANQVQASDYSVISGGYNNNIYFGNWSVIPGGQYNVVGGNYSFAAGQSASTYNNGTFIWSDSTAGTFSSTGDNQFCVRAHGGIQVEGSTSMFFTTTTRQMLNLFGIQYGIGVQSSTEYFRSASDFCWFKGGVHNNAQHNPGGGTEMMRLDGSGNLNISGGFGSLSDRNAKEKFEPVRPRDVLEKVTTLPVSRWSYKTDPDTRHVGPMAQDFYAAFSVGTDNKHIGLGDEGGVALAAIQGLNEKVESENAFLREQLNREQAENTELKERLDRLEKLILSKNSN
jgi:hypothetical protein